MVQHKQLVEVRKIMADFARLTGLASNETASRRYLWTDAFAVCNYFSLYRQGGQEADKQRALDLIDQVHTNLGRHRRDDPRRGWISDLDQEDGENHPTRGGLRIGKNLNERPAGAPYQEAREWEQDGQYFHYLTKWMHALERAAVITGEPKYCRWAIELAKAAHAGFVYRDNQEGVKRMYWKMSIDLSRPLVTSMGHHDPLDALVTYHELRACRRKHFAGQEMPDLAPEIADAEYMCRDRNWATDDPLGLGGLLFDACRVFQMALGGMEVTPVTPQHLIADAHAGLGVFVRQNQLSIPADHRLAFRELGLSLGLRAVQKIKYLIESNERHTQSILSNEISSLLKAVPLADEIENYWSRPASQKSQTWLDHRDINMVMLATSLLPKEFLSI